MDEIRAIRRGEGVNAPDDSSGPVNLLVLVHGLSGLAEDLQYLKKSFEALCGDSTANLVYLAASNVGKTDDGVENGGARLAKEITEVVARNPTLRTISLMGASLGGNYMRYAIAVLWDEGRRDVAGLQPVSFVTIVTPHLGLRKYSYLPLPTALHKVMGVLPGLGQTGSDLFLRPTKGAPKGEHPLLVQMATRPCFLRPLRAFSHRRAYANLENDFMVPIGSGVFHRADTARSGWGLFTRDLSDDFAARATKLNTGNEVECELVVPARPEPAGGDAPPPHDPQAGKDWMEGAMAEGLDSVGWSKIGMRFTGITLPLAHNLMCMRDGKPPRVPRWLCVEASGVMEHAVQYAHQRMPQ